MKPNTKPNKKGCDHETKDLFGQPCHIWITGSIGFDYITKDSLREYRLNEFFKAHELPIKRK